MIPLGPAWACFSDVENMGLAWKLTLEILGYCTSGILVYTNANLAERVENPLLGTLSCITRVAHVDDKLSI